MNQNEEFLNYIHQNSEMGMTAIRQLLKVSKDIEYKHLLQSQYNEYEKINQIAKEKLKERESKIKETNKFSQTSTNLMINLETLRDKSPSHLSEMLIQGSTMGIIDMTKKIKRYQNADQEVLELANSLLKFEHNNIEECKKYLQ